MSTLESIKNSPTAISLSGWVLFYSGLLSVVGLYLAVGVVALLGEQGEIPLDFAFRMGGLLTGAAAVTVCVFAWALRRWARHFSSNARRYGLFDIAMIAVIGLALCAGIWFLTYSAA